MVIGDFCFGSLSAIDLRDRIRRCLRSGRSHQLQLQTTYNKVAAIEIDVAMLR
jgi:hypothetical protein